MAFNIKNVSFAGVSNPINSTVTDVNHSSWRKISSLLSFGKKSILNQCMYLVVNISLTSYKDKRNGIENLKKNYFVK